MLKFGLLAKKIFGSSNDRQLKQSFPLVEEINNLEEEYQKLNDSELKAKTGFFKTRLNNGETLDDLLPEAFATVREASVRSLSMRPFDVQLMGGIFLHRGNIAEMKTGEGKTLTAVMPVYLNALTERGVHVVTVNEYLAKRDAEWMGKIYEFLGLSVASIYPEMDEDKKKNAYSADITYTTNNELGFDYLRDNMKSSLDEVYQRKPFYAIVDEVDSILIDEARTPLIISGPTENQSELYKNIDVIIPELLEEHFEIDEKARSATLTDNGNDFIETRLKLNGFLKQEQSLYDPESTSLVHHINQGLLAHKLFKKDRDYIVRQKEIVLIDEFTGRMMSGRRLSNGLHQAIEAKERVEIQSENVTFASVTFQNYFRLYEKLAGMTGTALTEADEFQEIYELGVMEIPTNKKIVRIDEDDRVFRTSEEKYNAVITEIIAAYNKDQPVLVGTISIDKSELISSMLKDKKIPHKVLNARYHEEEAQIIAEAGIPGAVTIATNMAGRGTDIQLGGNLEMRLKEIPHTKDKEKNATVLNKTIEQEIANAREKALNAGGLYVLATERHESRRIDNQLRGRSGRQGDPGRTAFFLSLEDDLMRIFGSERLDSMLKRLGMQKGESIAHPWVNKALERAQSKVEARNFDIRKNLLKYDDVMNLQRKSIFAQRKEIMESKDLSDITYEMRQKVIDEITAKSIEPASYVDQWDLKTIEKDVLEIFGLNFSVKSLSEQEELTEEGIQNMISKKVESAMAKKAADFGPEVMRDIEKQVVLQTIDKGWREHLLTLEHLRSVIGFRGYAQRDPLNEYKSEAYSLFESLLEKLRIDVTKFLSFVQIINHTEEEKNKIPSTKQDMENKSSLNGLTKSKKMQTKDNQETWGRVGRNQTCPCGSGKKFKHCHGSL